MPAPTATEQFVNWLTGKPMALFDAIGSIFNPSGPNATIGLVPNPGSTPGTTKFLREDGTFNVPAGTGIPDSVATNRIIGRITTPPDPGPAEQLTGTQANTILPAFTIDSGGNPGVKGLVPAPVSGDAALKKSLNADGSFVGNWVLLGQGTNTNQATLDIALIAGFRSFYIDLNVLPLTDGVALYSRFSPDGISYDATGYAHAAIGVLDSPAAAGVGSSADNQIIMTTTGAGTLIGNGAAEGWKGQVTILNPFSTVFWPRITFAGAWVTNAATPSTSFISGQGTRKAAQNTLAIRFLMSAGNITYTYALYGLP